MQNSSLEISKCCRRGKGLRRIEQLLLKKIHVEVNFGEMLWMKGFFENLTSFQKYEFLQIFVTKKRFFYNF